jgi:peptide/nickel transport system ATP-binding protein
MASKTKQKPMLEIRNLTTEVVTETGPKTIIDDVSFHVDARETLCIAGESGSGKSVTSLSVMGLLPPSAKVTKGEVLLEGQNLLTFSEQRMQQVRGGDIATIFQEPMTSLNPVMSIGVQLLEAIGLHQNVFGAAAKAKALEALDAVRISESARRLRQFPHELSGGMRQRVMIAMALAGNPKLLIADEPTTALDVTVQAQILALMNDLKKDFNTAIVLITHDMGVVAEMADRVAIMQSGKLLETGKVSQIFKTPKDAYTQALLDAVPKLGSMSDKPVKELKSTSGEKPVVEVRDLTVRFDIKGGLLQRPIRRVHAVENISFDLFHGETLALVGESGCGKTTIGKSLLNLVPWSGQIKVNGHETAGLSPTAMKPVRQDIQLVFQDPGAALNPRMTVGELVGEPLVIHNAAEGEALQDRVAELFRRVGLDPNMMDRHPHEFSGGQRQRICIARALSLHPKVIVADESVSALDVSVQAQVLDLLAELQEEFNLSYLFISHDMAVVEQVSHRVAVMFLGQIVEIGPRDKVFGNPSHPYTQKLLDAVPIPDPDRRRPDRVLPSGEPPSPIQKLDFKPAFNQFVEIESGHFAAVAT